VRGIPAPREGGPTQALYQVAADNKPPFYSALERAIESSGQNRAPASQWLATLKKVPGVKQEELEWSGIDDLLKMQEGPVDKQMLLNLVRDGGIAVDEVVLGGPIPEEQVIKSPTLRGIMRDTREAWVDKGMRYDKDKGHIPQVYYHKDNIHGDYAVSVQRQIQDADGTFIGSFRTEELGRFSQEAEAHRVFREEQEKIDNAHRAQLEQAFNDLPYEQQVKGTQLEAPSQYSNWSSDSSNPTYRELLLTLPPGEKGNPERAPSTHWDHEGVVAHLRFMEKADAEGKRVLFIEEVQSDWHQKGRDQGYAAQASPEEIEAARKADSDAGMATARARIEFVKAVEAIRLKQQAEKGSFFNFLGVDLKTPLLDKFGGILGVGPVTEVEDRAAKVLDRLSTLAKGKGWESDIAHAEALEDEMSRAQLRDRETRQHYLNLTAGRGIPNAPFKSSWPALVMKRAIRWAVDNGYDKVAWTTGEEQAQAV
jgi:hypothetical protein